MSNNQATENSAENNNGRFKDEGYLHLLQQQESDRHALLEELLLTFGDDADFDTFFLEMINENYNNLMNFSLSMLHEIYTNSPPRLFRNIRRLDFTEHYYWTQEHPFLKTDENLFKSHYRVSISTFEWLVRKASDAPEYAGSQLRNETPVEIQIALALWRFANTHYGFRIAEINLGVSAGTYNNITNRFVDFMFGISASVISWPYNDPVRALEIANGFKNLDENERLDNVIGAMDRKTFVIQKPRARGSDYTDTNNHASLNMFAVCDHLGRFLFVQIGETGRDHDEQAFSYSKICKPLIFNPEEMCPAGTVIIADLAFPLLKNLWVPFEENQANSPERAYYNLLHSRTRQKIEDSFGLLITRWRFLWKHLYQMDIRRMVMTIHACYCLHNICIDQNDTAEEFLDTRDFNEFIQINSRATPEEERIEFSELVGLDNLELFSVGGREGSTALRRSREEAVTLRERKMRSMWESYERRMEEEDF